MDSACGSERVVEGGMQHAGMGQALKRTGAATRRTDGVSLMHNQCHSSSREMSGGVWGGGACTSETERERSVCMDRVGRRIPVRVP